MKHHLGWFQEKIGEEILKNGHEGIFIKDGDKALEVYESQYEEGERYSEIINNDELF